MQIKTNEIPIKTYTIITIKTTQKYFNVPNVFYKDFLAISLDFKKTLNTLGKHGPLKTDLKFACARLIETFDILRVDFKKNSQWQPDSVILASSNLI